MSRADRLPQAPRSRARPGRLDPSCARRASAPRSPIALFGILRAASRGGIGAAAGGRRVSGAASRRGLRVGGAAGGTASRGGIGGAAAAGNDVVQIAHFLLLLIRDASLPGVYNDCPKQPSNLEVATNLLGTHLYVSRL